MLVLGDDMLIIGNNYTKINELKVELKTVWNMLSK